ncbi:MAG: head completion/stabilization protein [Lysobacteraceae bacterium]
MSAFVATAPTAVPGSTADSIANDGWFPDLQLSDIRAIVRLDGTVTDDRLRDAVRFAMLHVNQQLDGFRVREQAKGALSMESVSDRVLDGKNRLALLYLRAVSCWAKADLLERYRSLDSTDSGLRRADEMATAIDEQRRNTSWALRDIQSLPRTVVELI